MRDLNREIRKSAAVEEIIRCAKNPIYFIDNYCKIQHPKKGLVSFKTYKYQKETIKNFLLHDRVIVNKPRQMGYSTLVSAFIAWMILFHNDKSVLIISKDHDSATNVIKKIKTILTKLPIWMHLADITKNQEHTVGLSNGSWAKSIARTSDAGRSEAISLLVFDEAAYIKDLKSIYGGASYTTATGGKIIMLSTPSGPSGLFYEFFTKAKAGENNWVPLTVNWWDNPDYAEGLEPDHNVPGGYTSPWFKNITIDKTEDQIRAEMLTSFIETGDQFISVDIIQKLQKRIQPPLEKRFSHITSDTNLWIWKTPIQGNKYLVSLDTGLGSGDDSSGVQVIELMNCEVVCEYRGKIPPDILADLAVYLGEWYNNAYILPENNGYGLATAIALKRSEYKNIVYLEAKTNKLIDKWNADNKNIPPGISVSSTTRPAILAKLKEYLEGDKIISYSERLVNEILTFNIINGKPQAAEGFHDDLIMSLALSVWVRDMCPDFGYGKQFESNANMYNFMTINSYNVQKVIPSVSQQTQDHYKKVGEEQFLMRHGNMVIDLRQFMTKGK